MGYYQQTRKKPRVCCLEQPTSFSLMECFIREAFHFLTCDAFFQRRVSEYLRIFMLKSAAIIFKHSLSTLKLFGLDIIGQRWDRTRRNYARNANSVRNMHTFLRDRAHSSIACLVHGLSLNGVLMLWDSWSNPLAKNEILLLHVITSQSGWRLKLYLKWQRRK